MQKLRTVSLWVLALLFVAAGANHFRNPAMYLKIMPPYLPMPLFLVYASGVCEMALGVSLWVPKLSRWAAWGLIALLVAVFPANLYMAQTPGLFPGLSPVLLYFRLPLQAVLMAWVFWHTRPPKNTPTGGTIAP